MDSNFIVSSRGSLTIRCTAVDVLMPRMVGMRVVSIPVEIISDSMQEPDEAMWVFGHPIVADYPQNTGNTIYVTSDVVLALGDSRLISAQQQQTARRNLFTIAASPANTRTLSLTGSASGSEGGGALSYQVTPDMAFTSAATATWTVVGRGDNPASDADFTAVSGAITFPASSTAAQTITLTPNDDRLSLYDNILFIFECFHDQQDSQWREKASRKYPAKQQ